MIIMPMMRAWCLFFALAAFALAVFACDPNECGADAPCPQGQVCVRDVKKSRSICAAACGSDGSCPVGESCAMCLPPGDCSVCGNCVTACTPG